MRLLSAIVGIAAWHLLSVARDVSIGLPTPVESFAAIPDVLGRGEFWEALSITLSSLAVALVASLAVSWAAGVGMALSRTFDRVSAPYMGVLLATPMVAVVPAAAALFGLGVMARLVVVMLFVVPHVAANVAVGYQHVKPELIEMGRVFGAGRSTVFLGIRTPAALAAMISGVRIGVGRAFVGVLVAEMIILVTGIGRLIVAYSGHFQSADLYALIILTITVPMLILAALARVERRILIWQA